MWDVNQKVHVCIVDSLNKFDLNYVGCELRERIAKKKNRIKFDLNYVGCEPVIKPPPRS